MRAALTLIEILEELALPWIFEHPHASYCFKNEEWLRILRRPHVHERVLDQCRYGAKWRKRTRMICGNCDEYTSERLSLRCTGKRGFCSHNGRKHLRLEGVSPQGVAWTSIAQAYPPRLCHAVAAVLTDNARASIYNSPLD